MIIVDYSQTIISNFMAEVGNRKDIDVDTNLLRHMVLNTIRSYNVKFKDEYGELIIACDNRKYWRKAFFPYYKGNRKRDREDSGMDWESLFNGINTIKEELKEFSPYRVIDIEGAEADDIIATLSSYTDEKVVIVSSDHDFFQLQKFPNVSQYSPNKKRFVSPDVDVEYYIFEHIIKGDKGDGVPNVLTNDDAIVAGERQKPVTSKKLNEWYKNPESRPGDETFIRNFQRNKTLVDFSHIPEDIKTAVINNYESHESKNRSLLIDYFNTNRMKLMLDHIEDF